MPTPTPMKPDDGAEKYYLVKHGLYYRPNACGYTANVSEAGHFDYKYAMSDVRATAGEKDKNDRVQMIPVPTSPTPDRATELAQWLRNRAVFESSPKATAMLLAAATELERLAQVEAAAGELREAVVEHEDIHEDDFDPAMEHNFNASFAPVMTAIKKLDAAMSAQPTPGKAGA